MGRVRNNLVERGRERWGGGSVEEVRVNCARNLNLGSHPL